MKFYTETHKFTCGIDLHSKNLHLCIQDQTGKKYMHRRISNDRAELRRILAPYRKSLVVSVESTFNWYWLGDFCAEERIPFVLGHAQYMKAIHQGKTKSDRVDSEKITKLTTAKLLPIAYVYPADMRKVRDLLRRRLYFVRERAALKGHVKIVASQYNLPPLIDAEGKALKRRRDVVAHFEDHDIRESVDCDLRSVGYFDSVIRRIEKYIVTRVTAQDKKNFDLLCSVPGIGTVLGLTILYEMHKRSRFPRCQDFLSYARLVRSLRDSNGTEVDKKGRKIGNPYLKWAFSEVAVHMTIASPEIKNLHTRLEERYGAAGAWSRLSQKAARTVYYMLKNEQPFDLKRFLIDSKNALESKPNSLEPTKGGSHGH